MNDLILSKLEARQMNSPYLDFASGFLGNLVVGSAMTDAIVDAAGAASPTAAEILAATLQDGVLSPCAHDTGAVGDVFLPVATAGTHCALEITGDMDEANAFTVQARGAVGESAAVFAKQLIGPLNEHGASAQTVETAGTVAAPTSVQLIYTPAAADTNFLGAGSVMQFYCPIDGQWVVRITNIVEGTGATGVFTVA
jgi:hypothetical protein|tara:strand:+ start:598 stop:1188 length:591 start_codon:yes stop_codon:yes gene_type:complete